MQEYDIDELKNLIELKNPGKVNKIIKIPTNTRLLKIIYEDANTAQKTLKEGIIIGHQKFTPSDLEKEKFVNLRICMRCYDYDHLTKECPKDQSYKVCSECAQRGHRFNTCKSAKKRNA